MKKAIVTLVIGKRYEDNFSKYCSKNWREYADRHGFDLHVINERLDDSEKSYSRSPAWQKLLILSQQDLSKYDQVVWVDSDIMINPKSPDICQNVPIEKIGAVDEYAIPSKAEHPFYLERTYAYWAEKGVPFINSPTSTIFIQIMGLRESLMLLFRPGSWSSLRVIIEICLNMFIIPMRIKEKLVITTK